MTETGKLQRLTLSAQITQLMEKMIREGQWAVGEKIPGELELMAEFGVSRNTLREALQALVFAGLLQTRPGDGTYILSENRFDAALQKRLRQARLGEVLETRLVLETDIARLAAARATREELAELRQALAAQQAGLPEREFIQADREFHLCLARLCHNQLLYDMYSALLGFWEELISEFLSTSGQNRQLAEHRDLCQAIAGRQPEAAAGLVRVLVDMEKQLLLQIDMHNTKEE